MEVEDELLVTREVAGMTRLPEPTLRYFRHKGTGPASFRLGRKVVYRRSAVLAWIEEQERADPRGDAA